MKPIAIILWLAYGSILHSNPHPTRFIVSSHFILPPYQREHFVNVVLSEFINVNILPTNSLPENKI